MSSGWRPSHSGTATERTMPPSGLRWPPTTSVVSQTSSVERHGVWHRVHTAVANGDDNLRDPEVRAQYRYAVALRGDAGTLGIGELVAAERG